MSVSFLFNYEGFNPDKTDNFHMYIRFLFNDKSFEANKTNKILNKVTVINSTFLYACQQFFMIFIKNKIFICNKK